MIFEKVSVSGRFLREREPTGTHRSAKRLLEAVASTNQLQLTVHAHETPEWSTGDRNQIVWKSSLPAQRRWDHLWEQTRFPFIGDEKTLWTLMGSGPVAHPGKRHVMVVHDLNYSILPEAFGNAFRLWYQVACGLAAKHADVIVCFTDYVSQTIQHRLGISAERIHVIPQGPGLEGISRAKTDTNPAAQRAPYFLCVGSLQPHKNLRGVLEAWKSVSERHPGYSLKIVGRAQANFSSIGLDLKGLPKSVLFTGYVSDEELILLYQQARGFVYPSLEEGFGLPIVEAFYCGCPVITSNTSCLPEVAGDAALLVDPHDSRQIAEAMDRLASDNGLCVEYSNRGLSRADSFTWERAGLLMAQILSERVA